MREVLNVFMDEPQNPVPLTGDLQTKQNQAIPPKILATVIVVSLVAGLIGGIFGAFALAGNSSIQKLLARTGTGNLIQQNLVVDEESATTQVVKDSSPAVVSIIISKDLSQVPQNNFFGFFQQQQSGTPNVQQVGAGSGFFVSSDGTIITNKHVVSDTNASYTVVTNDGRSFEAKVLSRDPVNDLAIIKIDIKDAHALQFADSSKAELGQHVVAIGNSLGQYQNTVTTGVVSGIGRSIVAGDQGSSEQLEGVIQTDAAINPGNSGGPLLNLAGQVIGINTAVDQQGQSVGFAIPSNDAKVALESYQKNGKITRPYLGVRYIMLNDAIAQQQKLPKNDGALLIRGQSVTDFAVIPGSPADKAGLKENDIIMTVDGQDLNEDHTLSGALQSHLPGDQIIMKVFSGGAEKTVTVTLGETS